MAAPNAIHVRFEHHREPLGIGRDRPRISWTNDIEDPGWTQAAYELALDGRPCGRVESGESLLVAWPGEALRSRERRTVAVRVWGGGDPAPGPWSDPVQVEAGLLLPSDWSAVMIAPSEPSEPSEPGGPMPPAPRPAFLLRRAFTVRGPVVRARLYGTAHGVHEL